MVKRQLELSLGYATPSGESSRRTSIQAKRQGRRQSRTAWWFARMRQVVDDGLDRADPRPMN
jgi:hypothetical protein